MAISLSLFVVVVEVAEVAVSPRATVFPCSHYLLPFVVVVVVVSS